MTTLAASRMACHECDLLVDVPELETQEKAFCPRCNYLLAANRADAVPKTIAFATTALIFLVLANVFPFLSLSASGQEQTVTLMQSISSLFDENQLTLSIIVFMTIIVVPAILLLGVIYFSVSLQLTRRLPGTRRVLRWVLHLAPWSMAEIFLIGVLVSFIKIVGLATVSLGLSFWAYALFTVNLILVLLHLDRRESWRRVSHA